MKDDQDQAEVYTLEEICTMLQVSKSKLKRMVKIGDFPEPLLDLPNRWAKYTVRIWFVHQYKFTRAMLKRHAESKARRREARRRARQKKKR
jgi:hypothetical protein